jgi:hypothetical protein
LFLPKRGGSNNTAQSYWFDVCFRRLGKNLPKDTSRKSKSGRATTINAMAERSGAAPDLRRTLKLHHLILYGIVIIQPTAPMSIFGVVSNAVRDHVVTTIL